MCGLGKGLGDQCYFVAAFEGPIENMETHNINKLEMPRSLYATYVSYGITHEMYDSMFLTYEIPCSWYATHIPWYFTHEMHIHMV